MLTGGPIGLMQAAMDVALPYVRERKQFDQPIGTFGLMQGKIADMYTALQSSRAFAYQVARDYDAGHKSRIDAAACLLHASECRRAGRAGRRSRRWAATATSTSIPTGRLLRDAKLYAIGAGTNEIRRMLIGRELFDGQELRRGLTALTSSRSCRDDVHASPNDQNPTCQDACAPVQVCPPMWRLSRSKPKWL